MFSALLLITNLAFVQNISEQPESFIRSNVREVLLDIVVRHRDMSLDKKLKASDFTITEDGVPQTVKTFRLTGAHEAQTIPRVDTGAGGSVSEASNAKPLRELNFVSIVFGEMGPDSRHNAIEAATDFLNQKFQGDTYTAVFRLGLRLNLVQEFSNDRATLTKAVLRAVNSTSTQLASASAGILNETTYSTGDGRGGISITANADPARNPDFATSGASQAPLSEAQKTISLLAGTQRDMVSSIAGMNVMNGLLRLVEYESKLPGRKTILYLSEGLIKPPSRSEIIRNVISAANRGNISFYCLDIRGLLMNTSNGVSNGLLNQAAGGLGDGSGGDKFDLIALAQSSQVQLNMAELAEGTGGFAIFSTNDFEKNMARVTEDISTHYEISYVPILRIYDGHFRKVKVTMRDPKLIVQNRNGYFALPDVNGVSIFPYEAEGLHALQDGTRHEFDFRVAALRYKPLADGFRYEMAFELDTSNLTTRVNLRTHLARLHGTFVALIKGLTGEIVTKVSQEIDQDISEDKLDQFRKGKIVFTSSFDAVPGRYTVEAAAMDPEGNRASTKRISLVVPNNVARSEGSVMSSLVMVREVDRLSAPRDLGNPLEFAGGKILPELGQSGAAGASTTLFFVIYPKTAVSKPKVTVSFFRDGTEVARTEPDPGAPDEVNSMPILAAAKLPSGEYLAKVTVEQDEQTFNESIAVSVQR